MKKSVKKYYEIDRKFDYGDWFDTKVAKKFTKKRSHKRLRKQLDSEMFIDVKENNNAQS